MWHNRVIIAAAVATLAGCNMAPPHNVPALPVSSEYMPETTPGGTGGDIVATDWKGFFKDERLLQLIDMALANNRDLRVAVARIDEAKAQYRIQRTDELPKLNGSADAIRSKTPASGQVSTDSYNIGVGVSAFELDFWGRVHNLSEAARARYLGTVAAERAFRLSLIRDLATAYVTSRSLAEQADEADRAIVSREYGLKIAKLRLDAGVTSAVDYRQAETLLTQAQTQSAALRNQRVQQRNIIRLAMGAPIDEETLAPARKLDDQQIFQAIDAGLPSALLVNRPDIIEAEENLRAARADIGAARAAFFPSISLTGQFGFESTDLDNLFSSASRSWSFGPAINLPIFDWGARNGNLDLARAREVIQIATYEKTVQTAFREVSDALANRRYLVEQIEAQERAVEGNRELARISRLRYDNGVTNYLQVLDAERNLFSAQQELIQLRGQELSSVITLYAALGGGLGSPSPARTGDAVPAATVQPRQ